MTTRVRRWLLGITGGAAATPLVLLTAINAADELDRVAFGVLLPEIRDHFGLDNQGALTIVSLVTILALGLQPFVGYWGDRTNRVRITIAGAIGFGAASAFTGLAPAVGVLILMRCIGAVGRMVNDPTGNSLLADFYATDHRTKVFGFYRGGNGFGQAIAPLTAGILAHYFGWRLPFVLMAIPTAIIVVAALARLREPIRGSHERREAGGTEESIQTEEEPPSFSESWRICNQVRTLRRIWLALPFLAVSLGGFASVLSIFYEDVFNQNEAQRGVILAAAEPFQLLGVIVGVPIAARLFRRRPGAVLSFLAATTVVAAVFLIGLATSPNVFVAIAFHILFTTVLGALLPGIYATLSLVIPPRARGIGFALGSLFALPGIAILSVIGAIADESGARPAMLVIVPVFMIGGFLIASAGAFVESDMAKVRASSLAQADVLAARRRGEAKLLLVKELDAGYDGVQVLFGVDFEVDEGEIIALLGTNGAGKSTLLRSISGLLPATAGAVIFDGGDMTHSPPHEVAARGVVQVPGGKGVFPGLTVEENLKIAGWLYAKEPEYLAKATEEVLGFFPVLRERWEQPAGNLSGGEQQMVTLAQAFIARPRLLMIDELSLGLAPVIVEQLLGIVRAIRERGTTIILVEQSVNVALTIADTAYFMEKGEIRFHGPTRELLDRPDVLRSVFLEGTASVVSSSPAPVPARPRVRRDEVGDEVMLDVREITRSYGGITAVDGVSFELRRGEILGVIGPNGAGKTTMFDIVSGFVSTERGSIALAGFDITSLPPDARARLGLGRSFQDARLFPGLTVAETIELALEREVVVRDPLAAALSLPAVMDDERRLTERTDELLELMGLGAFADKFVAELSTGSRRIVDLACVLAHKPDVLLFDEPSSGIAQRETEALGPLLLRIREATGASLLVIEHDMPLVTSISDRMLALDLGRVVVTGTPDEVVNHPDVVASYLGSTDEVIARSGTTPRSNGQRRRRAPLRSTANGGNS